MTPLVGAGAIRVAHFESVPRKSVDRIDWFTAAPAAIPQGTSKTFARTHPIHDFHVDSHIS